MTQLKEWVEAHEAVVGWLVIGSVVMFIGTLIVVPILVARIRADYFVDNQHASIAWWDRHPVARVTAVLVKNLLGVVFLAAGIVMLPLPGQGLLTIFIGLTLLSFPGKRQLELWVIRRGPVLKSINWLRRKQGQPPLEVDGV